MAIVIPTLHTAAILRGGNDDGSNLAKYLHVVKGDFARAKELTARRPRWDESTIWKRDPRKDPPWCYTNLFPPSVEYVYDFCRRAEGRPVSVDVECTGKEFLDCQLICVGMASANGDALNIPLMNGGGDHVGRYWSKADEPRVREAFGWLALDTKTEKWFQNGASDTTVLWHEGMPVLGWAEDLMQLGHCYDPEMPQNLGYLASRCQETELPFWKDISDDKGNTSWLNIDPLKLRSYNLRDCLVPLRAIPWYLSEIRRLGLERLYRAEMAEVHIMRKATWRGIEVDLDRRDSTELVTPALLADPVKAARLGVSKKDLGLAVGLGPRMEKVQRENLAILQEIAEHEDFNPNSHEQLSWLLYEKLRFPIVLRSKKTGKPSTDKNAMVLLGLHALGNDQQKRGLLALARYRKASKIINTNVRNLPILGDGRVHPSWKKLPVTGRFASSPNCQNWNSWIKRMYCARRLRDGVGRLVRDKYGNYVFLDDFVSIDLNQAELRMIGYQSSDPDLLRMYEDGINVHTANTTLTFGIRCPPAANKHGDQLNNATERYLREKIVELHESMPDFFPSLYDDLPTYEGDPVFVKERWKSTRTLTKNETFGSLYGAIAETLFDVLRSKRDQNTDDILFPDLQLADVETFIVVWNNLHPALVAYQDMICEHIQSQGFYRCPISGRIIWLRGGFERNKMLNYPTQTAIAAHMSRIIEVNEYLEQLSGGGPLSVGHEHPVIVQQVHDSATVEGPKKYTEEIKEIFGYVFNRPFDYEPSAPFKRYEQAILPADEATVGSYLSEI